MSSQRRLQVHLNHIQPGFSASVAAPSLIESNYTSAAVHLEQHETRGKASSIDVETLKAFLDGKYANVSINRELMKPIYLVRYDHDNANC